MCFMRRSKHLDSMKRLAVFGVAYHYCSLRLHDAQDCVRRLVPWPPIASLPPFLSSEAMLGDDSHLFLTWQIRMTRSCPSYLAFGLGLLPFKSCAVAIDQEPHELARSLHESLW